MKSVNWTRLYLVAGVLVPSLVAMILWNPNFTTFYSLRVYGQRMIENKFFFTYVKLRTSSIAVPPAVNAWYGVLIYFLESITGNDQGLVGHVLGLCLNFVLFYTLWDLVKQIRSNSMTRLRIIMYVVLSPVLFSIYPNSPSPTSFALLFTILATREASHSRTLVACLFAGLAAASDAEIWPASVFFVGLSTLHHGWQGMLRGMMAYLGGCFVPALPFLLVNPTSYIKTVYMYTPSARFSDWVPMAFVFRPILQSAYTQWLLRFSRMGLAVLMSFFGIFKGSVSNMLTILVKGIGSHDRNVDSMFAIWVGATSIFSIYSLRSDITSYETATIGILLTILVMGRSKGKISRMKAQFIPTKWLRGGFVHLALICANALSILPGRFLISSVVYHAITAVIGIELLTPEWERRLCVQKKDIIDSGEIGLTPDSIRGALKTPNVEQHQKIRPLKKGKLSQLF